jgi:aminodeoxyfutalosine deaminase
MMTVAMSYPKIELHVHFEGAVKPETLLLAARRNGVELPADSVEGIRELYRFTDFRHFIQTWLLVTAALQTAGDFRQVVTDYAEDAARHGAVYLEGIFSPAQNVRRGVSWQEVFEGYSDGIVEARERFGVEVRLTPDMTRGASDEEIDETVKWCIAYMDRGVVALGLGGYEAEYPPELYTDAFRTAIDAGLGSVPHAGEVVGPASVWGALEHLHADRVRHGFRSVEDPALVRELAARGTVLDTSPISNVRIGLVPSLDEHPVWQLIDAGVRCSLSTDDPAMFDTDLTREYAAAAERGRHPRTFYEIGVEGALCDEQTRARLRQIGEDFDWSTVEVEADAGAEAEAEAGAAS